MDNITESLRFQDQMSAAEQKHLSPPYWDEEEPKCELCLDTGVEPGSCDEAGNWTYCPNECHLNPSLIAEKWDEINFLRIVK